MHKKQICQTHYQERYLCSTVLTFFTAFSKVVFILLFFGLFEEQLLTEINLKVKRERRLSKLV
jgi:hypothetical protein